MENSKKHGIDIRYNEFYIKPDLETKFCTKEEVVEEKNEDRFLPPIKYHYKSTVELSFKPMKGTDEYTKQI